MKQVEGALLCLVFHYNLISSILAFLHHTCKSHSLDFILAFVYTITIPEDVAFEAVVLRPMPLCHVDDNFAHLAGMHSLVDMDDSSHLVKHCFK